MSKEDKDIADYITSFASLLIKLAVRIIQEDDQTFVAQATFAVYRCRKILSEFLD